MEEGTGRKEYDFIVNPRARSGMGMMVWNVLEPELKKRRIPYRVHLTGKRNHAQEIAASITGDGTGHMLVILGGDGTVNEVINGIVHMEKTVIGYIPIGSSNDFARGLGIAKDPEKALEAVLFPRKVMRMDVGEMTRAGKSRRFAVSSGIGFDAAVCHEVCVSKWKVILNRLGLGKLSYAVVALDRLMKDRPVRMELTLPDGSRQCFERTYFAAFMNLRYEGGGFMFCPDARPDDGMLDVILVHDMPVLKILCLLPTAFVGKHTRFSGITLLRCRSLTVEAQRPLPLHMDGEPGFPRRSVSIRILDEKLRVIVG